MRIYKKNYYILAKIPGISGFQEWDKREYFVCTGHKAAHEKSYIIKQFLANGRGIFELEDGHISGHRPIVKEKDIYNWLDNQKYSRAKIMNPEVYELTHERRLP